MNRFQLTMDAQRIERLASLTFPVKLERLVRRTLSIARFILIVCCIRALPCGAQQACSAPASLPVAEGANIFTPQQEADLGDAVAERLAREFRVIVDDQMTAHLKTIAERLIQQAPPNQLRFRVFLFDLPVANAFSLPGGRIYVSRKLIAFVRNEDELAAVLGHEMGHILSHQLAVDMTRRFRSVLGVTQVGDRHDIFEKFNRLIENAARNPKALGETTKHEEQEQYQADQIALYVLAGSGYSPQSFVDFWDRFAQTHGKTGGWLSDVFGFTKPNERRLREMRQAIFKLPPACQQASAASPGEQFLSWQAAVIGYSGLGRKESLHGLLVRKALDPPLRSEVRHLRFSPDGHYVLAQDDSSIFVLAREPFQVLFRIDASEALPVQFTPDSQSVVFSTSGLRVEHWNVADESRTLVRELVVQPNCMQTALAPDGKTLACFDEQFALKLIEVASGAEIFTKKPFFEPRTLWQFFFWMLAALSHSSDIEFIHMGFSPDARYFLAGQGNEALGVDLATRKNISLPGSVKNLLEGGFAFLGADRLAGVNPQDPQKSPVVRFPSGEELSKLPIARQRVAAPTHGDYLILRPVRDYPLGVMDLNTKKIRGFRLPTIDLYDQVSVHERRNGELALYENTTGKELAVTKLPDSPLSKLWVSELSADLQWLAVSGRTRGAVFKLADGHRTYHIRAFRGAYFDAGKVLYADFPKYEETDRTVAQLALSRTNVEPGLKIGDELADQYGRYLVMRQPEKKDKPFNNVTLRVQDVTTGKELWSQGLRNEAPDLFAEPEERTLALVWGLESGQARQEIKNDSQLREKAAAIKDAKRSCLVEVLDLENGKKLGRLLVDTGKGSFRIKTVAAAADWVIVVDSENRTVLYSLATGQQQGAVFGAPKAFSRAAGLLAVENEPGQLDIYTLPRLEKTDQLTFSHSVPMSRFSTDGKRLFVLTANQVAYFFDTSSLARPVPAASPGP